MTSADVIALVVFCYLILQAITFWVYSARNTLHYRATKEEEVDRFVGFLLAVIFAPIYITFVLMTLIGRAASVSYNVLKWYAPTKINKVRAKFRKPDTLPEAKVHKG